MTTCTECGSPLPHDADPRRLTCSTACRKRRFRRVHRARRDRLRALMAAQETAATSGDTAALAEIARQAARLLGEA